MNLDENMFFKRIVARLKKEMPVGSGGVGPAGPKGDTGAPGAAGTVGATGSVGSQGPKGDQGVAGPSGAAGAKGDTGLTGAQGPIGLTGAAGAAGKDAKRIETYTGTTDANGLVTITYTTAFPAVPSVQPEPPTASNQVWVKVTSTTTGCSLRLVQRAAATVLTLEVLLAGTTNVVGAPARVVVVAA